MIHHFLGEVHHGQPLGHIPDLRCKKNEFFQKGLDLHVLELVLCQEKVQIKYNQFSLFM